MPPSRPAFRVRMAETSDRRFMLAMLAAAAAWRGGVDRPVDDIISRPQIAHYLPDGWPRAGEIGVVATRTTTPIGAAWWTRFTLDDPGYGFVATDIPELGMGVVPAHRSQGIGEAMLDALCGHAHRHGVPALSLSVESDNPAIRLYRRMGFTTVEESDGAHTMLRAIVN